MSDNPFLEPEDNDRTIIRPMPGGQPQGMPRRAAPAPPRMMPAGLPVVAEGTAELAVGANPLTAAAAPLLQLLARLRNTASPPESGDLRERAVQQMRAFETRARAAGVPPEQLSTAHYALCASLDDVVLATPWGGTGGWGSRSLVSTFHQEVRSGERFFDLLRQMVDNPGRFLPVIELMYLCMSLGFVGRYRLMERGLSGIERVREETYAVIARHRPPWVAELAPHTAGVAAPYRPARLRMPLWVAGSTGLAAVAAVFMWFSSGLNAASDDLYDRMLSTAPAAMPQIARAVGVQPPARAPAAPTVQDRLRQFLAPEIQQGLVAVLGTPAAPLIRIGSRTMFPSGSAILQPGFAPLLERIGAALSSEPGPVLVTGHTDNQAIRTVAFPSNFQLSKARARAAAAIVERTIGNAGRLSSEGRAEAEPVAPNATPTGREQNRRIEVLLQRTGS